jgi:cytochrome c553
MAKKLIYILLSVIVLMFITQIIIVKKENPQVTNEPAWDSQKTKATFMKVCGDCHSNETKWPLYSNIPPFSFLIYSDVVKGRAEFNVSEFNQNDGIKAAHELEEGEMPLWIYTIMHKDAVIEGTEKTEFLQGLESTFGKYSRSQLEKNQYNHTEE